MGGPRSFSTTPLGSWLPEITWGPGKGVCEARAALEASSQQQWPPRPLEGGHGEQGAAMSPGLPEALAPHKLLRLPALLPHSPFISE